jgi:hypothetical protein
MAGRAVLHDRTEPGDQLVDRGVGDRLDPHDVAGHRQAEDLHGHHPDPQRGVRGVEQRGQPIGDLRAMNSRSSASDASWVGADRARITSGVRSDRSRFSTRVRTMRSPMQVAGLGIACTLLGAPATGACAYLCWRILRGSEGWAGSTHAVIANDEGP